MDIISFWDSITFTPLYKEKGLWIHGATVNSGVTVQLRVVAKNKATYLRDMEWVLIFGTPMQEKEKIQYFGGSFSVNKVLSVHNETNDQRLYVHKWEPYTVSIQLDPNVINMHVSDDTCALGEIISKPSFTIKKLK